MFRQQGMSFASVAYFIFLPLVFCLHWAGRSKRWQNAVLLAASYIFYSWWDWRFSLLMFGSSLVDYSAGLLIHEARNPGRRKAFLVVALTINLSLLGFFKYFNFFADNLVSALSGLGVHLSPWTLQIVLPVGISFYTFQTMSYTVDIYFGRFQPLRNVVDYLTFVSFFPQLVAGPIERATDLLPQFHLPRKFSLDDAREGCRFIAWGLAKKMLVADNLSLIVEDAFRKPEGAGAARLFLGTICFAFQIYCDFSAYSDMAVGTAKLFGVRLMRNFAYPYFSQSLTEFWRRWHISLSTWFRDYVYIPLGGNRGSAFRRYRNIIVVMLVSGLWHGAAWHFIAWGAVHAIFLCCERFLADVRPGSAALRAKTDVPGGENLFPDLATLGRIARTFAVVCVGWIFFRANTLSDAWVIIGRITVGLTQRSFYGELVELAESRMADLSWLVPFLLFEWFNRHSWNTFNIGQKPLVLRWAAYTALCWYVVLFGTKQTAEFIYFQF